MPKVKEKSKPIKVRGKDVKLAKPAIKTKTEKEVLDVAVYKNAVYDKMLDGVEKDVGISSEEMATNRLSTGTLSLDMVIGGGMRSGMMTQVGQEGSAKSTSLLTTLSYAADVGVPIVQMQDAEGCLIGSDKVLTSNSYMSFDRLFELAATRGIDPNECCVEILTPEGKPVIADLFYGGEKPTVRVDIEGGFNLTGYNHPVLVVLKDGTGIWKRIEDLEIGDEVLTHKLRV